LRCKRCGVDVALESHDAALAHVESAHPELDAPDPLVLFEGRLREVASETEGFPRERIHPRCPTCQGALTSRTEGGRSETNPPRVWWRCSNDPCLAGQPTCPACEALMNSEIYGGEKWWTCVRCRDRRLPEKYRRGWRQFLYTSSSSWFST
jgi:hypothetical protein